ncbi:MAG: hypothetical protein CMK07_02960 [Ponticaulis sp.]|nr:hypothetical protein [Ponticaulis sp.]
MPESLEWIIAGLAVIFALVLGGMGVHFIRKNARFRKQGTSSRLKVLDLAVIVSGGSDPGTQIVPIYEILDGPRAGETLRSDGGSPAIQSTVTKLPDAETSGYKSKLKQIGEVRTGWVHPTEPIAMAKKDQALIGAVSIFMIGFAFMALGLAVFLIVN